MNARVPIVDVSFIHGDVEFAELEPVIGTSEKKQQLVRTGADVIETRNRCGTRASVEITTKPGARS